MRFFKPKLTKAEIEYQGEKVVFWIRPPSLDDATTAMDAKARANGGDVLPSDGIRQSYKLVVNEDGSPLSDEDFAELMTQPIEVSNKLGEVISSTVNAASVNTADAKKG